MQKLNSSIFCCPQCKAAIDVSKFKNSSEANYSQCLECEFRFVFVDGVLDFIECNEKNENISSFADNYDEFWDKSLEAGDLTHTDIEKLVVQKHFSHLNNSIVMDVGCGDGRNIPILCNKGVDILICLDSSKSIYRVQKKFGNFFAKTHIFYVRGDIQQNFIQENCVNAIWAFGIVNFFPDQKYIVETLASKTIDLLILGLVSGNLKGKIYKHLNIFRPFSNFWISHAIIRFNALIFACLILFSLRLYAIFFRKKTVFFEKFTAKRKPIKKLQHSLMEPFISSTIYSQPLQYYINVLSKASFKQVQLYDNSLTEIVCFQKSHT